MGLYITMKSGATMDLRQKADQIRKDLIEANADDLSNRREWFTKKYRGNRLNDVNVGIWDNLDKSVTVQIFVQNKNGYIKEQYKVTKLNGSSTKVEELSYDKQ